VDQTNTSHWIGYTSSRAWGNTDTRPTIQASGISTFTLFKATGNHVEFNNLIVDGGSLTASTGIDCATAYTRIIRCKAINCTTKHMNLADSSNSVFAFNVETSGGSGIGIYVGSGCYGHFLECHGHTNHGIQVSIGQISDFLSYNNTGASSDGVNATSVGYKASRGVVYGNGRAGMDLTGNAGFGTLLEDILAEGNTAEGFRTDAVKAGAFLINCGGYNNSSNYNATNLPNVLNFQAGTTSFFTNAAGGDFSLNSTTGGGALARAAGTPGAYPAGTTTGHADIGAAQHADPASPATNVYNRGKKYLIGVAAGTESARTLKAMLVLSTYTFNADLAFIDDGTGTDPQSTEAAGGTRQTLSSLSTTEDDTNDFAYWTFSNPTFPTVTASQALGGMIVYAFVTNDTDSFPIAYFPFSLTTAGGDITVALASAGSGGGLKAA
jgi:hypothetical protein